MISPHGARRSLHLVFAIAFMFPMVVFAKQPQLELELQTHCMDADELGQAFEDLIFPGLQKLVTDTANVAAAGGIFQEYDAGQVLIVPSPFLGETKDNNNNVSPILSMDGFSITSGGSLTGGGLRRRRDLVEDTTSNNTAPEEEMPVQQIVAEEEEGAPAVQTKSRVEVDCPVYKKCPCNGCPGHWCLLVCGYVKSQRRFLRRRKLLPDKDDQKQMRTLQEDTNTTTLGADWEQNLFSTNTPTSAEITTPAALLSSAYCDWLRAALADIEDTCLRTTQVLHCQLI